MFSKERAGVANLYAWRMIYGPDNNERERMANAADFAYRQALALCPSSPEAIYGYANFLKSRNRDSDAAFVSGFATEFPMAGQ
jgi:hypothetical protein